MTSTRLALAAVFLVIVATVVQSGRIVRDDRGTELEGAYVWIADAEGVQLRLRTDARGRFHAWHRPFGLRDGNMLICAPGHSTLVTTEIVRAWVSEFGIGVWPANAPFLPKPDSTWRHTAPLECTDRVARTSS